jgi:predicted phage tail protein
VRTIRLYGHLGQQFGKTHQLDVKTPAEVIRALSANFKNFAKVIADGQWRVLVGGKAQSLKQIENPLDADISIVPAVGGAGGLGKIILGAALIAASFYLPGMTYFSAYSSFGIDAASIAKGVGTSMVLGGVSQMLFAPPKANSANSEPADTRPSYVFNGPVNTTGQGNPVPVCYGQLRVGSQVISAGLFSEAI